MNNEWLTHYSLLIRFATTSRGSPKLLLLPGNLLSPVLSEWQSIPLWQTSTMQYLPCMQIPAATCSLTTMQQVLLLLLKQQPVAQTPLKATGQFQLYLILIPYALLFPFFFGRH